MSRTDFFFALSFLQVSSLNFMLYFRGAIGDMYSTSTAEARLAEDKYPSPAVVQSQPVHNSQFGKKNC